MCAVLTNLANLARLTPTRGARTSSSQDIKSKYDSRIARTYRTKIESDGTKLHKKLGAALFDSTGGDDAVQDEKDFFEGELAKKATADSLTGTVLLLKA